jgi:hypothetical protein
LNIIQALDASFPKFRGEVGDFAPVPAGPSEYISRCFMLMLVKLFSWSDVLVMFPNMPKDFLANVVAKKGVLLKGSDAVSTFPALVIDFPVGTFRVVQLGVGTETYEDDSEDRVIKERFTGSISIISKGRTTMEAIQLADIMKVAFFSRLSDALRALSIHMVQCNIGQCVEDKKSNDVVAWTCTTTFNIDIPDLEAIHGIDYRVFTELYMTVL